MITPIVLRINLSSATGWSSGVTAMHSITIASAPHSIARRTMRVCSIRFGRPTRKTSISRPSGSMMRAWVPVVFARVRMPPARIPAAISRVTEDLPRVPLTWIRSGTRARFPRWERVSHTP